MGWERDITMGWGVRLQQFIQNNLNLDFFQKTSYGTLVVTLGIASSNICLKKIKKIKNHDFSPSLISLFGYVILVFIPCISNLSLTSSNLISECLFGFLLIFFIFFFCIMLEKLELSTYHVQICFISYINLDYSSLLTRQILYIHF